MEACAQLVPGGPGGALLVVDDAERSASLTQHAVRNKRTACVKTLARPGLSCAQSFIREHDMAVTYRPRTPHSWKHRAEALDRALDSALEELRIVGGLLLVSQQGEPVYQRAAGLADRESGRPVRLDTLFRYASLTK